MKGQVTLKGFGQYDSIESFKLAWMDDRPSGFIGRFVRRADERTRQMDVYTVEFKPAMGIGSWTLREAVGMIEQVRDTGWKDDATRRIEGIWVESGSRLSFVLELEIVQDQ